ncbi:14837_t:CDS:1 [Dentiscutata erythropus]|uniref:14837_t:CDS:1 n=1 Tax=Dentiscutata erythropus TaxID=1348616 RepID=A0A9N9EZL0_9GLOM|nr:14837_t:CDS:1 [Dentiscutata erythropus]
MQSQDEITILYNGNIENYRIKSLNEKYTNGRNFELKVYNFLRQKEYHVALSDSHPMISNFRFFWLTNKIALQIGNCRIAGDGSCDIIGDKNGIQIFVQAKFSITGKYPNLNKAYMEFANTMKARRPTNEIGIFVVSNNINIGKLKNITSAERKIIICHFEELEGYIEQIEEEHNIETLKLFNAISNANDCLNDPNSSREGLKNQLITLKSYLENISGINNNIMSRNTRNYINIKNLNKVLDISFNSNTEVVWN